MFMMIREWRSKIIWSSMLFYPHPVYWISVQYVLIRGTNEEARANNRVEQRKAENEYKYLTL